MTKTWKLTVAAAMTGCLVMANPVLAAVGSQTTPAAARDQASSSASSFVIAEVKPAAQPAGAHAPAAHGDAGHGGEHGGGFPPFNPRHFTSQLVWLVISFGALYLLMSRVTLPRIARILEERRDRIARDLEEAALRRSESEAAQVAYEKALVEARNKANAIAGEARNRLTAESDSNRKTLEASLASKLEEAERRITATKSEAMSHVRGIAVDTAQAIVSSLAGTTARGSDVEQAVDAALVQNQGA